MNPAAQLTSRNRLLNTIFLLVLVLFILIATCVHFYPDNRFDRFIQNLTRPLAAPARLSFWIGITFFGSFEFLFPTWLVFILICVWKRKIRLGLTAGAVAAGGFLSMEGMKQIFQRHRPPTPLIPNVMDFSFPSGHTTSSLIFCAVLAYSFWHTTLSRPLQITGMIFFMLFAFSIGLSRIVLEVHYPTDVAAGFCVGTLWVISWYRFIRTGER